MHEFFVWGGTQKNASVPSTSNFNYWKLFGHKSNDTLPCEMRWVYSIMSSSHGQNGLLKVPNIKGQKSCFWNTQNKKWSASGSKKCTQIPPSLTQQQAVSAFSPACNYQRWQLPQVFPVSKSHPSHFECISPKDRPFQISTKGNMCKWRGKTAPVHWFSHIISKFVKPIISPTALLLVHLRAESALA